MKLLITVCLVAAAAAAPPSPRVHPDSSASILAYMYDHLGFGNYRYAYEQSDGTRAEQVGKLKNEGTKEESLAVSGKFQWVGPDGVTYTVNYTADEGGYKPEIEQGPGGAVPAHVASLLG